MSDPEKDNLALASLRDHLSNLPAGPVEDAYTVQSLLSNAWDYLEGGADTKMDAYKVSLRMEEPVWNPPTLEFTIERHGRTACGSTRADVHHWSVDVEKGTASWAQGTHRQLYPMNPPLKVQPLAEEIAGLITEGIEDDRLRWRDDGSVQVQTGKVIPGGWPIPKETTQGRRKRFRKALEEILEPKGWDVVRPNVYRPRTS